MPKRKPFSGRDSFTAIAPKDDFLESVLLGNNVCQRGTESISGSPVAVAPGTEKAANTSPAPFRGPFQSGFSLSRKEPCLKG
jgi:hypothetical protein